MREEVSLVPLVFCMPKVAETTFFLRHLSNFHSLDLLKRILFATFTADFSKEVILI
jgi:hypothetical protein